MTTTPDSEIEVFNLEQLDWDIACEINPTYHDVAGSGPAEWCIWWKPSHPCSPLSQYACSGCYETIMRVEAEVLVCRHCGEINPGPIRRWFLRAERIK